MILFLTIMFVYLFLTENSLCFEIIGKIEGLYKNMSLYKLKEPY